MELYEVVKSIGSGNYGQVYLVRHKYEGRNYVVKKIKTRDMPDSEREKTEQEVKLLQKLRHANIVAYKDSYIDRDQFLCIVMVNCEGGDMYSKIKAVKGKKFTEAQILEWFAQILLALLYLHDKRILHRDLKTQNIFLKNSKIRLGDFGIAKVLDGTRDFANTCIGTPYYMSPELFKNRPYSFKSDVWGLGCVIYEMCNLRHAFDAQSLNGLAMKIMKGTYPPTTPFYSKGLRDLISKMLSVNPMNRPTLSEILNFPFVRRHVVLYLRECFNPSADVSDLDDLNIDSLKDQAERLGLMPLVNGESKLPQPLPRNPQAIEAKLRKEEAEKLQIEEELNRLATQKNEMNKMIQAKKKNASDAKANDMEKAQKQKMLDAEKRREKILEEKKKKAAKPGKRLDSDDLRDDNEEGFSARERVIQMREKKKKEELEKREAQLKEIHQQNNVDRQKAQEMQQAQFRTSSVLQSALSLKEGVHDDESDSHEVKEIIEEESESEEKLKPSELMEVEQKYSDLLEKIKEKTIRIDELRESLKFAQSATYLEEDESVEEAETPLPGMLESVEEREEEEEMKEEPPTWHSKIRDRIKLLRQ
jgi:non-specific serine/threonine protein kinase/NIMA (never in mitosis gene a)-related kinase